ncbi:hypothetical protein [Pendulispora albinea]|uniref:4Fe-4S ferredoxin-type domain-containing protein n=1 Tax=Pendulispora albinea TaxID=2741071 RepID=A0ABZ2LZC2_9BACT
MVLSPDPASARQWLDDLASHLRPAGLDVLGVADPAAYDAEVAPSRRAATVAPGTRAIVVVGNGGRALWDALLADLARAPNHLTDEPHPLEAFVKRTISDADSRLGDAPRRWIYAASHELVHLDFRVLGLLAGLGTDGRLRLLMHREHGPWMALRAACFVSFDLPLHVHRPGPSVCDGCPAPCITACPGNALSRGTWDVDRCSAFHAESNRCSTRCDARLACPKGAGSRYPLEMLTYHSNNFIGREWIRAHLGIARDLDRHPGMPPLWETWRERIDVKG